MSQRPDIEEDFHTQISLSLSLSFCELRKRKSQQQLVITCDTQTSTQQINSFEKSRGIEGQGKNKQPHEIVLHSSSFFVFCFPFCSSFFLGFEKKNMWSMPCRYKKKTLKKLLLSDKFFLHSFAALRQRLQEGAREL